MYENDTVYYKNSDDAPGSFTFGNNQLIKEKG